MRGYVANRYDTASKTDEWVYFFPYKLYTKQKIDILVGLINRGEND